VVVEEREGAKEGRKKGNLVNLLSKWNFQNPRKFRQLSELPQAVGRVRKAEKGGNSSWRRRTRSLLSLETLPFGSGWSCNRPLELPLLLMEAKVRRKL